MADGTGLGIDDDDDDGGGDDPLSGGSASGEFAGDGRSDSDPLTGDADPGETVSRTGEFAGGGRDDDDDDGGGRSTGPTGGSGGTAGGADDDDSDDRHAGPPGPPGADPEPNRVADDDRHAGPPGPPGADPEPGRSDDATADSGGGGSGGNGNGGGGTDGTGSVPDYDGRKVRMEGPEAPGNPTDEPRTIVEERGGQDGQRVRSASDDPFRPDADSRGLEERGYGNLGGADEDDPTAEAVQSLQSEVGREVPGIDATETDAYNVRQSGDQLEVVLTDQGRQQFREATGQPTRDEVLNQSGRQSGGDGGGNVQQARSQATREVLQQAGLSGAAGAASEFVSVTRQNNRVQASLTEAGERASVRRRFAAQQGVDPDQVRVEETSGEGYRARITGDPTPGDPGEQQFALSDVGPVAVDQSTGAETVTGDPTSAALAERAGTDRVTADEFGELFAPDRSPADETGNPVTDTIRDVTGAPTPEEIVADVRAQSVVRNEDVEANLAAQANREVTEQTGVNPRQRRADLAADIQGQSADLVQQAQENPGKALAVGLPAAALEPTPGGEAAIISGAAAGAIGVDLATSVRDGDTTRPSPVTGEEIPAPTQRPGEQAELDAPSGDGQTSELDAPQQRPGTQAELDAPQDGSTAVREVEVPTEPTQQRDPGEIRADVGVNRGGTSPAEPTRPGEPASPSLPDLPDPAEDIQREVDREYVGERVEGGVRTFGEEATEPEVTPEQGTGAEDIAREIEESVGQGVGGSDAGGVPESVARELGIDSGAEAPTNVRQGTRGRGVSRGESLGQPDVTGEANVGTGVGVGTETNVPTETTSLGRPVETTGTSIGVPTGEEYIPYDSTVPGNEPVPNPNIPPRRIPTGSGGGSADEDRGDRERFREERFSSGIASVDDLLAELEGDNR